MEIGWKIDWDAHIIFLEKKMTNKQLLDLIMVLTQDPRALLKGAEDTWTIVTTTSEN